MCFGKMNLFLLLQYSLKDEPSCSKPVADLIEYCEGTTHQLLHRHNVGRLKAGARRLT